MNRMTREEKTIQAMIHIFCKENHNNETLCNGCKMFEEYALFRLKKCPFQEGKSSCGKCKIHCYKPDMKEKAKEIMRYSGPKMIKKHPYFAVMHLFDSLKKAPDFPIKKR